MPAPARTTIRLYLPFLIDSMRLSSADGLVESRRLGLRIK
jgi:hypothetical protein